jgi:hypothetical protein
MFWSDNTCNFIMDDLGNSTAVVASSIAYVSWGIIWKVRLVVKIGASRCYLNPLTRMVLCLQCFENLILSYNMQSWSSDHNVPLPFHCLTELTDCSPCHLVTCYFEMCVTLCKCHILIHFLFFLENCRWRQRFGQ